MKWLERLKGGCRYYLGRDEWGSFYATENIIIYVQYNELDHAHVHQYYKPTLPAASGLLYVHKGETGCH